MQRVSHLLPLVLLASASVSEAQNVAPTVRRGLASALAAGLSVTPSDRVSAAGVQLPERVLIKPPLDQTAPPPPWAPLGPATVARYDTYMMFPTAVADRLEIDAQSIGQDIIPTLSSTGRPDLAGAMSWMGVTVSYDNAATGQAGSNIERRRLSPSGVRSTTGADLHSYYLEGSVGLHSSLIGRSMVEITSEAMGLGASDADIDALDFGMGVLQHGQTTSTLLLFQSDLAYYFSVTPASAMAINQITGSPGFAQSPEGSGNWVPAHGATIYRIKWDNNALTWGDPHVFRSYLELGLTAVDDVDGLAVDPSNWASAGPVVLSTQLVTGRSQLLAHHPSIGLVALTDDSGDQVSDRLGGVDDTDNIDSVCIIEPHLGEVDSHVGTPEMWFGLGGKAEPLGISITRRRYTVLGTGEGLVQVTGAGQGTTVVLFGSSDYQGTGSWTGATWLPLDSKVSSGAATEFSVFVPPSWVSEKAYLTALVYKNGQLSDSTWTSAIGLNY